jgi:hypothetical protein
MKRLRFTLAIFLLLSSAYNFILTAKPKIAPYDTIVASRIKEMPDVKDDSLKHDVNKLIDLYRESRDQRRSAHIYNSIILFVTGAALILLECLAHNKQNTSVTPGKDA